MSTLPNLLAIAISELPKVDVNVRTTGIREYNRIIMKQSN
jgi:hypothetical protein